MKLFGSGNASRGAQKQPRQKKPKRKLTRNQVIKRVVIIVAVIAALCAAGAAVWVSNVRAPDPMKRPNNPTIVDTENGDEPELDMGDRVADYFTFVVGAVDEDQTRTDALMVCGFDTKNKKINILNIPRDTMSDVARKGPAKKINAAYGTKKGIEQTKAEIKKVIGFSPDYYIVVNFQGIADIVDAIGGVDYEIPFRMYYKAPSQNLNIDFKPGMTHMDGKAVVEFLRWRKNNGGVKTGDPHYTGGDEERIDKQQEFLKYLASQVLQPSNIANIGKICDAVFSNVKTDLSAGEILWMGMQAVGTPSENIQMHKLPGYDSMSYANTGTMYSFFFPNERETLALVNEFFNPYVNKLTNLDIVSGPDKSSYAGSKSSGSSKKDDKDDEDKEKPATPPETDPEQGVTDPENGQAPGTVPGENGGTVTPGEGDGTAAPPADGGDASGTPDGSGGATGEGSGTDKPADGGSGDAQTTTPPADSGSGNTNPPSDSGTAAPVTPPTGSVDPEA
ncbi:LCP family protein [Intestinibacillus massiliensis]|nr:LCP family protein [Intestinibacillus massiliensis]